MLFRNKILFFIFISALVVFNDSSFVFSEDLDQENVNVIMNSEISNQNKEIGTESQISESTVTEEATETAIETSQDNLVSTSESIIYSTPTFKSTDRYFEVVDSQIAIYDNSTGKLIPVAYLTKGQVYPRVSDWGDWHQVKYGNGFAYIYKGSTVPADGSRLKNLNSGLANRNQFFIPKENLAVYDNSSGSLVPFATLIINKKYPIISDYGDWYQIDVSGRIGYVYKPATTRPFEPSDRFFQVTEENIAIYDNSSGKLIPVIYLNKDQVYPRVADSGDWHQVKYGNGIGYVYKGSTTVADSSMIRNLNPGRINLNQSFIPNENLAVYDNSTGKLVPFATLVANRKYPILSDYGDWYQIDVSGRIGYVYKGATTRPFEQSDRFFQVNKDNLGIYDNSTGKLIPVAYLTKGQIYSRLADLGDWHQVKFGNGFGYVFKGDTSPAGSTSIKNLNSGLANQNQTFISNEALTVYDNSTGKLIPFATLNAEKPYPFISDLGDWYLIDVAGRLGYVYKPLTTRAFTSSDRYFEVMENQLPFYDNSTGTLKMVGYLTKGQVYPRVADYGDWHQIKVGNGFGYVLKSSTKPASSNNLKNINPGIANKDLSFIAIENLNVFDNSSGKLVPFATLPKDTQYPVLADYGDWYKVDVSGRIGYVYKGSVQIGPVYNYTYYNLTLDQMWQKQLTVGNYSDKKYSTYVRSDALIVDNTDNPTSGTTNMDAWRVRGGPSTSYWEVGKLDNGEVVTILGKVYNEQDGYWWYQIKYNRTWVFANPEDVRYYLNPANFSPTSKDYYQFLSLSQTTGVNETEVNEKILKGKDVLEGKASSFISAAKQFGINEIYLISHALLETGNGKSQLAKGVWVTQVNGVAVEPKMVYNMYGIRAIDSCPVKCGSEYAYQQGWFTPEAAIIGGAKWIGDGYINDLSNRQDTLYKMKWNPAFPATYNYASDVAWAYKQVTSISNLYSLLKNYILVFDIPVYKK